MNVLRFRKISTFSRNVLTLASGTAFAQGISVLLLPVITRLYTPVDYGVYASFTAAITVLLTIVTLRYELTIVLPKEDIDARRLLIIALFFCAVSSAILLVGGAALFSTSSWFASWIGLPQMIGWTALSLLLGGIYQSFNYWQTRGGAFLTITTSKLLQSSSTLASQLLLVLLPIKSSGLLLGHIIGQAIGVLAIMRGTWQRFTKKDLQLPSLLNLASQYSDYPKYLIWGHLLNSISISLPIFTLTYFEPEIVGFWGLAYRLMAIPLTLIGTSIAQAFYSAAAKEKHERGDCRVIYRSTFKKLFIASFAIFIPLLLIPNSLYGLVLGTQWSTIGDLARGLAPLFFVRFITAPTSSVFMVMEKQRLDLIFQIIFLAAGLLTLSLGSFLGGGMSYVYCYVWGIIPVYFLQGYLSFRIAHKQF